MDHKRTSREIILEYREKYKLIMPDSDSIGLTKELWDEWGKRGITPPDIDEIARQQQNHELKFFEELVTLAAKQQNKKLDIHFCQFSLDEYNAYAVTAKDGFIILVDDVFFQILFFICAVLVFDSMEVITNEAEREEVRKFVDRILYVNYFNRQRIDFSEETIIHDLMKREYELTEFANYLFNSLKVFIISHEIGHHVLQHASGIKTKVFSFNQKTVGIEVDERKIECEFEADDFGYKLFHLLSNTDDESVYYAWCKYKLFFAPILLFDLFNRLDRLQERIKDQSISYHEHPHPDLRIKALKEKYAIDSEESMYLELKASLGYFIN